MDSPKSERGCAGAPRHWVAVGRALQHGRDEAGWSSGSNSHKGRAFNVEFGKWLTANNLGEDRIDRGTRSRLHECIKNLPAVTEWYETQPLTEKMRTNHPNSVWRKWKAHVREKAGATPKSKPRPSHKEEVIRLEQELARMKANGGDRFGPTDRAEDIAKVLYEMLSETKLKSVIEHLLKIQVVERRMTAEQVVQLRAEVKERVLRS